MNEITITLPIYREFLYSQRSKYNDQTKMVGMNWYTQTNRFERSKLKKEFHEIVAEQIKEIRKNNNIESDDEILIDDKFETIYNIYYKNVKSDMSNIRSAIEKFALDGLTEAKAIEDDNIKYHVKSSTQIIEVDTKNPRLELIVKKIFNTTASTERSEGGSLADGSSETRIS